LALLVGGLAASGLVSAATVLTITEQHHRETPPGMTRDPKVGQAEPTDSTDTLTLVLTGDVVQSDDGKHRLILDFGRRRMIDIDLAARTYQEHSLYHMLGFAVLEFQNRLMLSEVMSKAKVGQPGGAALVEQLFAFTDSDSHTKIDVRHHKEATEFLVDKTLLVRASDALTALPAEEQRSYWKWFRYILGGHPQIDSVLEQKSGISTDLQIRRPNVIVDTVSLHIQSSEVLKDLPYTTDGYTQAFYGKEIGQILKGVGDDARLQQDTRVRQALKDRDQLIGEGKALEAFLANSVYLLSTGDQDPSWLGSHREALIASEDASALFGALGAKSKDEREAAVSAIETLKAHMNSPYAYVLDIYLGNSKSAARQDGRPNLIAALKANPYVTGAWFDLGGLLFGSYEAADAWDCWDFARSLRPDHPFRKMPDDLEKRLVAEHPEFY
jgi:hypothetical protein